MRLSATHVTANQPVRYAKDVCCSELQGAATPEVREALDQSKGSTLRDVMDFIEQKGGLADRLFGYADQCFKVTAVGTVASAPVALGCLCSGNSLHWAAGLLVSSLAVGLVGTSLLKTAELVESRYGSQAAKVWQFASKSIPGLTDEGMKRFY